MELPDSVHDTYVRRGSVLHSTMFEDIDHGKFFVIIGVSDEYVVGFFFINPNITRSLFGKPDLLALQYQLFKRDYDFLRYDSFLNASNMIKRTFFF